MRVEDFFLSSNFLEKNLLAPIYLIILLCLIIQILHSLIISHHIEYTPKNEGLQYTEALLLEIPPFIDTYKICYSLCYS